VGQYHQIISLTAREFLDPYDLGDGAKLLEFIDSSEGVLSAFGQMLLHDWSGHRVVIAGDYMDYVDLPEQAYIGLGSELNWNLYDLAISYDAYEENLAEINTIKTVNVENLTDFDYEVSKILFDSAAVTARKLCYDTGYLLKPNNSRATYPNALGDINSKKIGHGSNRHVIANLSKQEFLTPASFGDFDDANDFTISGNNGGAMTALAVLLAVACKGGSRGGGDISSTSDLVGSWGGDRISIILESELDSNFKNISVQIKEVLVESGVSNYRLLTDGRTDRKIWQSELGKEIWISEYVKLINEAHLESTSNTKTVAFPKDIML
jgi:hypothetical protein